MPLGAAEQVIGLFLAVRVIATVADGAAVANQPVHQFLEICRDLMPGWPAMTLAVVLVVISQVEINVTNAYSDSLAWTNSSTPVTRHHPRPVPPAAHGRRHRRPGVRRARQPVGGRR